MLLLLFALTGSTTQDTIPFELVRNQILLRVQLDGAAVPWTMLLDTGVNPSGVHLASAREAGLPLSAEPVGNAAGAGSTRSVPIYASAIVKARVGNTLIDSIPAVALDNSFLSERLGRRLDGVLGYSFLRDRRIRIDYPARVVIVEPAELDDRPGYRGALTLVPGDIMPLLIDLEVNGVAIPVSLDTGSSLTLELFPEGAARARVAPVTADADTVVGARGGEAIQRGRAELVTLGSLRLTDQDVALPHRARGSAARLGNLGNGLLRHFVLTIDYRAGTISITEPIP